MSWAARSLVVSSLVFVLLVAVALASFVIVEHASAAFAPLAVAGAVGAVPAAVAVDHSTSGVPVFVVPGCAAVARSDAPHPAAGASFLVPAVASAPNQDSRAGRSRVARKKDGLRRCALYSPVVSPDDLFPSGFR